MISDENKKNPPSPYDADFLDLILITPPAGVNDRRRQYKL